MAMKSSLAKAAGATLLSYYIFLEGCRGYKPIAMNGIARRVKIPGTGVGHAYFPYCPSTNLLLAGIGNLPLFYLKDKLF